MEKAQVSLLLKLLIELRAENLAFRHLFQQSGTVGSAGMDALIDEQRRRILALPTLADFLPKADEEHLATPLNTLLTTRLQ